MKNLIESEHDRVEAMSAFKSLQIKPTYLPIDIRLSVNDVTNMLKEKRPQHILFPHKIIRDVNNLRQNLYECWDIINISINSQFVRTFMTENVSYSYA